MSLTKELVAGNYEQKCAKVVESMGKNDVTAVSSPTAAVAREDMVNGELGL